MIALQERRSAIAHFQVVSEAYRVLCDREQREEWLMRSAVFTPPHMRFRVMPESRAN